MAQLLNLNQRLHQMAVDTAKRDIKANGIDIEELRTAADRAGVALQPAGFERAKANFNAGRTPIAGAMDFIEFFATSDQMLAVVNQVASARLKQQQQQEIVGLSDDIDQLRAELQELMKDPTAFQQFLEQHGKKLAVAAAGAALGTAFYLANPAGVQSFANDIFQSMEYEWKNHPVRLKGRVDQLASVVRLASKASGMGGVDNGTMASPLDMVAVGLMELSTSGALNIQEIMQKVESLAVVVSQELGGDGKNTAQLVPVGRLQRILQEEMATNPALREYPFMQDIMALNPADALPLGLIQARIDGNQELTLDALRLEMMAPEMIERALAQRSMGEKVGDTVNS